MHGNTLARHVRSFL